MTNLRCSKCGCAPAPGLPAKAGGTHYVLKVREKEVRKTEGRHTRASSCGTWIESAVTQ